MKGRGGGSAPELRKRQGERPGMFHERAAPAAAAWPARRAPRGEVRLRALPGRKRSQAVRGWPCSTHLEQGAALALCRQLLHHGLGLGRGLGQLRHGLGGLALQGGAQGGVVCVGVGGGWGGARKHGYLKPR